MNTFTDTLLILCMLVAPIIAFVAVIISYRKIHKQPVEKRRKRLIIIFCTLIFVLLLLSAVGWLISADWNDFVLFLRETFLARGFVGLMVISILSFIYGYFRKDKTNNQK